MRWLNSKNKKIKRWHAFLRELSAVEVIGNYIYLTSAFHGYLLKQSHHVVLTF
jgi:hypothetical protein